MSKSRRSQLRNIQPLEAEEPAIGKKVIIIHAYYTGAYYTEAQGKLGNIVEKTLFPVVGELGNLFFEKH